MARAAGSNPSAESRVVARRGTGAPTGARTATRTPSHLQAADTPPRRRGPIARVRAALAALRDGHASVTLPAPPRRALALAAVLLIAAAIVYPPARDWYTATRARQDLQARYDALAEANDGLEHDLSRLQSRDGIEDEARRRGYVEPGETSVIVENLPDEAGEDAGVAEEGAAGAVDVGAVGTRLLDLLFGYDA